MANISAIILTKNNQQTIIQSIKSLSFCQEVIVLDDYSSDNTISLIEKLNDSNLKILQHSIRDDFGAHRNFGLSKAICDWVLFLDSDEIVTVQLASEITKTINNKNINGYYFARKDIFMGRKLKYGETGCIKLLRLARKNAGRWQGKVHEQWIINGKKAVLHNQLVHEHNLSIAQFLEKIDWYSTLQSQEFYENGVREPLWYHIAKPLAKFGQNYIIKLGFLDGYPGFIMAWLMSWHSLLVRVKLHLLYEKDR